jgi:hypothetical protein
MAVWVDPNQFKVPYAIGGDDVLYQIAEGRPKCDSVFCPICRTSVSFVRETEGRAAHFRHHSRSECDALAAYHRQTLHDAVRDATLALLSSGVGARRICSGGSVLPTGAAQIEATQEAEGRKHRPDIIVYPKDGEHAPILELEVVYSHRPEPDRIERAAADGRLIGVLDVAPIERDYYRKLWASEAFDIPEACKDYVMDRRFSIMDGADIRRTVRGVLERRYKLARIRPEHMAMMPALTAVTRRQMAPTRHSKPSFLPERPDTCAVCGGADWHVSMTEKSGAKVHVGCSSVASRSGGAAVDRAVDSAVDSGSKMIDSGNYFGAVDR